MIRRTFPFVIGITGRAGAGKDTVATILTEALREYNGGRHRVLRRGLSDPVKDVCREVFGFTDLQLYGPSEERNKPDPQWDGQTPRRALQLCGTEFGRAFHPDTWIRKLLSDLEGFGARTLVMVPDVRFDSEAVVIRGRGGLVLRVDRHTESDSTISAHVSEAGVSANLIDLVVPNVLPLAPLREFVLAEVLPDVIERFEAHGRK